MKELLNAICLAPLLGRRCALGGEIVRKQNTGAVRNQVEKGAPSRRPNFAERAGMPFEFVAVGNGATATNRPDVNPADTASDFEALERLRKLVFATTKPAPKIPEHLQLTLCPDEGTEEDE